MSQGEPHPSQHQRETENSVVSPKPGEIQLSQVPQTEALGHQVSHRQGDKAVITMRVNTTGHEVTMCYKPVSWQGCRTIMHGHGRTTLAMISHIFVVATILPT